MDNEVVLCIDEDSQFNAESSSLEQFECRICQEEEDSPNLEVPCACTGSLKYAHRKCVQQWCNEKGDITCEICHQPYGPGYTAPEPAQADDISINIRGSWGTSRAVMDLDDSRLLAIVAAEHHLLEDESCEYTVSNASAAACVRFAALTLFALLLLRHVLKITDVEQEDDVATLFILFVIRIIGFLLTCYLMLQALNSLQHRRQRQEAAITVAEVALFTQARQT